MQFVQVGDASLKLSKWQLKPLLKTHLIFLLSLGCFPLRPSSFLSHYRLCIFICKFILTQGPSLTICSLHFTALCINAHRRASNWFPAGEALLWQECTALWLDISSPDLGCLLPLTPCPSSLSNQEYSLCSLGWSVSPPWGLIHFVC